MTKQTTLIEINGKFYPSTIEVVDEPIVDNRTYEEKVVALIREKYTIDQELAIQRQRYTKPEEFFEYDNYCEQCKLRAKSENI
jgi:hypothetical protein